MSQSTLQEVDQKPILQLFFVKNDKTREINVVEVQEVNFEEVRKHIELGESIFIAPKPKRRPNLIAKNEKSKEPWYFTHF